MEVTLLVLMINWTNQGNLRASSKQIQTTDPSSGKDGTILLALALIWKRDKVSKMDHLMKLKIKVAYLTNKPNFKMRKRMKLRIYWPW